MKPYYQDSAVTIYHGDCRVILPLLPKVDLVLTDPPYGMNYDTNGGRFTLGGRKLSRVFGDDSEFDVKPWIDFPYCILWGFNHFPTGLPAGGALVWIKRTEAAFGQFLSDCEIAWVKGIQGVYAFTDTVHAIACNREHPAQKPIGLMRWCIRKSDEAKTILDPFMGSGTTLRAAKDLGRKAIGIEIEEKYCEIAARRMEQEVLPLNDIANPQTEVEDTALLI